MARVLLPPPALASLLATSATIWLVLFCAFVEKLSANALEGSGVKIGAFPVGSPCYANYQCVKNEAFCEKDESEEDDESVYAYRSAEYKYRVEAEYGLHGYDDTSFMDDLAMNVARFATSVAKVMDVDARTVEALEVRGAGESQSRSAKSAMKVVFIKFGVLTKTLVEAAEKGNRLTTIPAEDVVDALREGGLDNVMYASASSGDGFIQVYCVGASDNSATGTGSEEDGEFTPPPSPILSPPPMPSFVPPPFSPPSPPTPDNQNLLRYSLLHFLQHLYILLHHRHR